MLPESLSKDGDDSKEGLRPIRPARLGKFVLDALLDHGKKIWEDHHVKYEKLRPKLPADPTIRPSSALRGGESGFTRPSVLGTAGDIEAARSEMQV
jgi:hypothetical protein